MEELETRAPDGSLVMTMAVNGIDFAALEAPGVGGSGHRGARRTALGNGGGCGLAGSL